MWRCASPAERSRGAIGGTRSWVRRRSLPAHPPHVFQAGPIGVCGLFRMMLRMVLSSNVDAMVRELGVEDPRALVWRLKELSILCEREVVRAA